MRVRFTTVGTEVSLMRTKHRRHCRKVFGASSVLNTLASFGVYGG